MHNFSLRPAASALILAVLAGCSLAPPYQRPDLPVATAYPEHSLASSRPAGAAAVNSALAGDIGWRTFFLDERLQILVARALENNRDLRIAALRIEEARAQYSIQSADGLPTLNGSAGATRSRSPTELNSGKAVGVNRRNEVGLSLAAFELDFFGRIKSLREVALAQYLATEQARLSVRISLVAEVARAYLTERSFAEQLSLTQKTLAARVNAYELAQKRFEVGASSALELRQGEALLEAARVAQVILARQQAQAENALVLLTAQPLGQLPPAQALSARHFLVEIAPGLPSDLLIQRPDIRAAEQRLQAANANIGAARAAFFPRISLTAGVGSASAALSGLFDSGSLAWSFAPQLVLPIFDGGRNRGNLSLAEVRKNIAVAEYEKTIQTAFREVADALVARALLDQQNAAQQAVLQAQAARLKLSELRFQNGIASTLEVLDAQREVFSAEQALVQAGLSRLLNTVDLYRSLGGGINPDDPARVTRQ